MTLSELVSEHRILVCVGSGGVGKTTMAATLALAGALAGRRSMVLTIDPARRLAQSLGLESLAPGGEQIPAPFLAAAGLDEGTPLSAGMLDQKGAWDDLIARHAPNKDAERAILDNDFYKQLSQSFAGSTEYMAVEELCRIHESGRYDLIVLDTPPTRYALDFLEAPARLQDFLDRSVLGWFVRPSIGIGRIAWRGASRSAQFLLSRLEEATGGSTLAQISDFFVAMDRLFDGLAERSRRVQELLRGDSTAFFLVTGPEEQVLSEADYLTARMHDLGVPLKGVIMNRVHEPSTAVPESADPGDPATAAPPPMSRDAMATVLQRLNVEAPVIDWLIGTSETAAAIADAEAMRREVFELELGVEVPLVTVPELDGDVHDLSRLASLVKYLVG